MMNDVYALSFSDHDLIGFNSKQNRVKTAPKTICCCNYCRYDHNKLKDDLKNADWSPVHISLSISDSLQAFSRILSDCNWTPTQNHLVRIKTLNHLAKLIRIHSETRTWHDKNIQLIEYWLSFLTDTPFATKRTNINITLHGWL